MGMLWVRQGTGGPGWQAEVPQPRKTGDFKKRSANYATVPMAA